MQIQRIIPFDAGLPRVTLTTDGSCAPNPGQGGWAYVLRFGKAYKEGAGTVAATTNNRMEMLAIVEGLKVLRRPCEVLVRTDSTICMHILNGTGRKLSKRANQDLVRAMIEAMQPHSLQAKWIKGHSGDPDNERCDELAMLAINRRKET